VEDDLASLGNGLFDLCPMRPVGIAQLEQIVGTRSVWFEADDVLFQERLELRVLRFV
jgi:hypothetical protein